MHPALLLSFALLCAASARAELFVSHTGFVHFNLIRGQPSSIENADLHVSANGVWSKAGLRRAGRRDDFHQLEITALDEPYDVLDTAGGRWRMWIRTAEGRVIEIELVRQRPARHAFFPAEAFEVASITIRGARAANTFARLVLFPDGRYTLGGARGRYTRDERGVTLDGVPGWGRAAYTLEGDGLVFRFERGPLDYEVRYQQVPVISPT